MPSVRHGNMFVKDNIMVCLWKYGLSKPTRRRLSATKSIYFLVFCTVLSLGSVEGQKQAKNGTETKSVDEASDKFQNLVSAPSEPMQNVVQLRHGDRMSSAESTAGHYLQDLMAAQAAIQGRAPVESDSDDDDESDESDQLGGQNRDQQLAAAPTYERKQAEQPEEFDENQAPDSTESLVKSEGENLDEPNESLDASQSSLNSDNSNNQQQNNNLVSGIVDEPSGMAAANVESQQAAARGDDDEDLDDLASEHVGARQQVADLRQPLANYLGDANAAPQLLMANDLGQPTGHQMTGLPRALRNSPVDLSAAAGHYYGKKKKKVKKKKIIIKKKKKKVKKIKKVKIYKKKKKPMKHHDHGKYYMYAKVPKKKSWEFGFKKGNKKHWVMRHEKGHKNKFKTKVKWFDKKSKGKGVHIWDYNHHDKKKKKHYG